MSLDLLKELREKTGIGMLDCKKALTEANGDLEKAIELLRKKGMAVAAKRADNATNCGSVAAFKAPSNRSVCLVQMSCETDFSANTDDMRTFATNVARTIVESNAPVTEDALPNLTLASTNLSVKTGLEGLIAKIAESIKIQRFSSCTATENGVVNLYIHPDNSIGVVASIEAGKQLEGEATEKALQAAKDICMHAAVTNPLSIDSSGIDPVLVAREKDIVSEQLKASGKTPQIIEKIAEGKMAKYYEDVCLLNQKFIKNDKITVGAYLDSVAKELGTTLKITKFTRFAIGR